MSCQVHDGKLRRMPLFTNAEGKFLSAVATLLQYDLSNPFDTFVQAACICIDACTFLTGLFVVAGESIVHQITSAVSVAHIRPWARANIELFMIMKRLGVSIFYLLCGSTFFNIRAPLPSSPMRSVVC